MLTYNFIYNNDNSVKTFLKQIKRKDSDSILIRLHTGIHSKETITSLMRIIRDVMPDANIIGCSAKYVIVNGEILEGECLISVSVFEAASTFTGRISCKDEDGNFCSGEEIGKKLLKEIPNDDKTGFMLVFFPYSFSRIDAVIGNYKYKRP